MKKQLEQNQFPSLEGLSSLKEVEELCKNRQQEYYKLCSDYGVRSIKAKSCRNDCLVLFKEVKKRYNIVYLV
jgi:hypothetical protein